MMVGINLHCNIPHCAVARATVVACVLGCHRESRNSSLLNDLLIFSGTPSVLTAQKRPPAAHSFTVSLVTSCVPARLAVLQARREWEWENMNGVHLLI